MEIEAKMKLVSLKKAKAAENELRVWLQKV